MKIGFLGNANNYPFMLARAMQRLGHKVEFIVSSNVALDRPENRYSEFRSGYPNWIYEIKLSNPLDWVAGEFKEERRRAAHILNQCDAIVLNQLGPSLGEYLRKPSIAFLTGSDLLIYCDCKTADHQAELVVSRTPLRRWVRSRITRRQFQNLIKSQRSGIKGAAGVIFFPRGISEEGDMLLDDIGVSDKKRIHVMMTEIDEVKPAARRVHSTIRLFCGTRHNWVRPIPKGLCEVDYKGTDILIRGIGLFIRNTGVTLDIRLVRKGRHVDETIHLLKEEGLADQVTWLDELDQDAYLEECRKADIVVDQLGNSTFGMVTFDGMALGRAVIANGRPEIFDRVFDTKSPICQAQTPEEVAGQLRRLALNQEELLRVGEQSRVFAEKYFSPERAAELCVNRFAAALE